MRPKLPVPIALVLLGLLAGACRTSSPTTERLAKLYKETAAEPGREESRLIAFFRSINLRDLLADRYQGLKQRYDIDSREVVVFLPLLFLAIFLLRGLMSFVSSYSFNRVGLAATTDLYLVPANRHSEIDRVAVFLALAERPHRA